VIAHGTTSLSLSRLEWSPTLQPFEGGVNIFAQRQGTDPQAGAVLVAAHYDTVPGSPGADDIRGCRRSGSCPFRFTSHTPDVTISVFDQEELGLRGNIAFAANEVHLTLRGVIVMDMVGFACYTVGCQGIQLVADYPAHKPGLSQQ